MLVGLRCMKDNACSVDGIGLDNFFSKAFKDKGDVLPSVSSVLAVHVEIALQGKM